ncbi:MAG: ATP-binding protein, partial [Anaerolineae bacterium]|nr:ATP-binding protein [Anaerolineae bacterium]
MVIPYISREDVSAALSSLIHAASGAESTGLEHLLLVDLRVTAPDMPAGDDVRRFVVRDLLVTEITAALVESRQTFGLAAPDIRTSLAGELIALADSIAANSHELTAWCVLYYRFVRADLSFSVERLAELLAVHTRTIARYTDEAIDLLTQRLIAAEQAARRQHLRRRLYAQLPYSVPVHLFGREAALQSAEDVLSSLSPRHILITGDAGIGKTAFVQELVRRQIDAENLDHLVWLNQPATVSSVRHQLAEALLMRPESVQDEQVTLRDYLLLYRVAVVLDEIDLMASDSEAFADLLRDLGAALVCLISRARIALEGVTARLHLTELARAEAEVVVRETLRLHPTLSADDRQAIAFDLYEHIGGNPLALRLAAGLWEMSDDWAALESGIHAGILARLFDGLSIDERHAWASLALHPHPVSITVLAGLWGICSEAFGVLQRLLLAEPGEPGEVMLVDTARDFIRAQYAARSDV